MITTNEILLKLLEAIFYLSMGFAILNEFIYIFKPADVIEASFRKEKNLPLNNLKYVSKYGFSALFICLIGLFTSQKILFSFYAVMGFLSYGMQVWFPRLEFSKLFHRIDGIICLIILIAILANKYYFHYTVPTLIELLESPDSFKEHPTKFNSKPELFNV